MWPEPQIASQPKISFDGYVRLTFDAFTRLTFTRKSAWEDAEISRELCAEGIQAERAGYCEWETDDDFAITVGWTWFTIAGGQRFVAPGGVSSNLMFVTDKKYDVGAFKTNELLGAWLSSVRWTPGSHRETNPVPNVSMPG